MPDGEVRHSASLYDSSAGFDRVGHMLSYARRVRNRREGGIVVSSALCELEPNFLLTAYIVVAHQERERDEPSPPVETIAVGDGSWLGDIRVVQGVVLNLDELLVEDAVQEKSGWEWSC